jgi:hypothetical protein
MSGAYFTAFDLRFWVKTGSTASASPTLTTSMIEVLSLANASIQGSSSSQKVLDYSSSYGFSKAIITENGYTINCSLNLDTTSEGYKTIKRAYRRGSLGETLQWYRELPIVGTGDKYGQVDAGVALVTNLQEDFQAGNVAKMTFNLEGYGVPQDYQQGSGLATLTLTNAGSGLSAGTGVALVSTSPEQGNLSGKNGTATITVNGSGVIQSITVVAAGQNYKVGDVLTITDSAVVGAGDTAPVLTVATVA